MTGTVKFGEDFVLIRGFMSWDGLETCVRIEAKMNASVYVQILEEKLKDSLDDWVKSTSQVIFQQGNDPKNTLNLVQEWFLNEGHGLAFSIFRSQSD